jgi:rare lipoprotein A
MRTRLIIFGMLPILLLALPDLSHAKLSTQIGLASWYGARHHGRLTANGEIFSRFKLTAAHRTLPLGTIVQVTNLRNGKDVIVKINDRGPYIYPRILDLSEAAAERLDMIQIGVQLVRIVILRD